MRHIKLVLEEREFAKFEREKNKREIKEGVRLSWEDFFLKIWK